MSRRRAAVENAADPRQVRAAARLEKRREQRWADSLTATLDTPQGRAFVWSLLIRTGLYESPFSQHGGIQSFNIGRGDVGRMVMGECLRLAPELYLKMETEARRLDELEAKAVEATHEASADEGDEGQEG